MGSACRNIRTAWGMDTNWAVVSGRSATTAASLLPGTTSVSRAMLPQRGAAGSAAELPPPLGTCIQRLPGKSSNPSQKTAPTGQSHVGSDTTPEDELSSTVVLASVVLVTADVESSWFVVGASPLEPDAVESTSPPVVLASVVLGVWLPTGGASPKQAGCRHASEQRAQPSHSHTHRPLERRPAVCHAEAYTVAGTVRSHARSMAR